MALIQFPNPHEIADDGFAGFGGELNVPNLLNAYRRGIFPWPIDDLPLPWFCPAERAILEFKDLHIPRSLRRVQRRAPFRFTIDKNFRAVVTCCARVTRTHEVGTWITSQMLKAYCQLHEAGHAHSVEAWAGDELVGGLYGVDAGGAFAGESMFHLRPNASKLALLFLIEHLRARGLDWLDIQVMTPHMSALGAKEIARDEFLARLTAARARGLSLFD
jgi:leucyl/phenylalanyl-tRNA--protein transferase